jgi:ribonuclease G
LLQWFRRKREQPEGAAEQAPARPEKVAVDKAPSGAVAAEAHRRRRRGGRGGKGRKKPETARAEARGESRAKGESKPEVLSQGQERRAQRRERTRKRQPPKRAPLPAAKRELLVSIDAGERRVAVLEDGRVAEVYLERPGQRSIAGNIYKGVVDNILPGMEAAFVEMGLEKNGFLYVDEIVRPELEGRGQGAKIQDLLQRGQEILVQAVKDPMKTKGARLTTDISLPGRFIVFVPNGEGFGVSRRLPDEERTRLREVVKSLDLKKGGVIVRTAAENASAEDIERDLLFLQRLWKSIQDKAKRSKAPTLVYQEAELPLRVTRDLFTGDFERAYVDHERTYKRVIGYLKKTSPHMAERVIRYKEKQPLFEAYGVDAEIRSTLSRRVDLPSGGYLVFDYAEAFTVIDVNTGRFVGSRSRSSAARLEDTITKNNLEAVKEVVRQLRLRDIGGIIVIDFIDMANPKNRAAVEEALRNELERDRTKTYVVEISPLGLVEMTRQNVTDGPREIMTRPCPVCEGDGIVYSEASIAVDLERRLKALATGSRSKAFRVELNARTGSALIGPAAERLRQIEEQTRRRFFVELSDEVPIDSLTVMAEGQPEELAPQAPVAEGAELDLPLGEVGLHDARAGVGKLDGYEIVVADAATLVGKKVRVRVERALAAAGFASLLEPLVEAEGPLTAEIIAEKPTRAPRKKAEAAAEGQVDAVAGEPGAAVGVETEAAEAVESVEAPVKRKRTRRGTRGGRRRRKKVAVEGAAATAELEAAEAPAPERSASGADLDEPKLAQPKPARPKTAKPRPARSRQAKIHVPPPEQGDGSPPGLEPAPVGEEPPPALALADAVASGAAAVADGEQPPKRKRTRRGTRGGRRRRKPAAAVPESDSSDTPS